MTDYTPAKARAATRADRRVVSTAHQLGYWAMHLIARLGRVVRVPGVGVIVSDAAIMRSILLDSDHFSKVGPGASSELWTPVVGRVAIINMDGPEHAHLRQKLAPMFTNRFLTALVGDLMEPQMADMKARLLAGEQVDIAAEIERTAALLVCRLAGYDVDESGEDFLLEQLTDARSVLGIVKLTTRTFTPEQVAFAHEKMANIHANIRAAYQRHDAGTVASLLRDEGLSEEDAVSVISALIIAGTETTVSHIPRLTQLLVNSGYLSTLTADNTKIGTALQEGFRVTVPSPVMVRAVRTPTRIGRVAVKPGDRIILANHEACQRAGDFDPERPIPKDMRQLWFGAGAHFCIGMPLAQLQTQMYMQLLADVHAHKPLTITANELRAKTLAAGYKKLVIQCIS
jgi:cytochrome P450